MSKLIEELEMRVLSSMPVLEKCKNEPFIRNHSMLVIELIKIKNVALRFVQSTIPQALAHNNGKLIHQKDANPCKKDHGLLRKTQVVGLNPGDAKYFVSQNIH